MPGLSREEEAVSRPERLAQQREQLETLLERHPEIWFAYLHGSALEGIPYHDLDVALSMSRLNDELVKARAREIRENLEKVRRYGEIEPERVLTYARENLGDFEAFLAAVGRLVA